LPSIICDTRRIVGSVALIWLFGTLVASQDLATAIAALEAGRLEEAAGVLTEVVRQTPDDADANYYLGLARFRQARPQEAIPPLERATLLAPSKPDAWKLLGLVFLGGGELQRASVALEKACGLDARDEDSCYLFARSLFLLGRYEEAVKPFEQALQSAPPANRATVHRALALDLDELGSNTPAEQHFREAVRLYRGSDGQPPDPRVDYGAFLVRQGRAHDALDLLKAAVSAVPGSARANAELGRALLEVDRPQDALGPLSRAIELDPKGWSTRLLLGKAYLRVGRKDEGERQMRLGREGWAGQGTGSTRLK
jgi:Flp pilus assembly protein TadD